MLESRTNRPVSQRFIGASTAGALETELARRVCAGDSEALDEFLRLQWHPLVAYVARLLASWDDAEDIAQETFLRLLGQRAKWDPTRSVRALIYRTARNLAINQRKWRRVR